ncbi:MAG TPA: hypothetical protein VEB00_00105 [Clostridia bacterium]|nr:hypothetical protein [Clostridia bacterium]
MVKRILATVFILVMAFQLVSCASGYKTGSASQDIVTPASANEKQKLTILYHKENAHSLTENMYIESYNTTFERSYGVDVEFAPESLMVGDNIDLRDMEKIEAKFAVKLVAEAAPDLIFTDGIHMNGLISQKAVAEVGDRIPNLDKVYDGLLGDEVYYVPIAMNYYSYGMKRSTLKSLGFGEPDLNWTRKDYLEIRDRWLTENKSNIYFTLAEFGDIIFGFEKDLNIFDSLNKRVNINTPEVKKWVSDIRNEIFYGKYKLEKGYTFNDYYSKLYENLSEEMIWDLELYQQNKNNHIKTGLMSLLRADMSSSEMQGNDVVAVPQYNDYTQYLDTYGFMVNKRSKNIELACEYINGLLNNETQLELYKTDLYKFYPVNMKIEKIIEELEAQKNPGKRAVELKKYVLEQIRDGKCKIWSNIDERELKLVDMLLKDLCRYIFADKQYSNEELGVELKKLENKYNLWLNE